LTDKDFDWFCRQFYLAWRSVNIPISKPRGWPDAILLQREIMNREYAASPGATAGGDLAQMLSSGELEKRLLYTPEEVEAVCQWVKDASSKERQVQAAKVVAAALTTEEAARGKDVLNRTDVARVVCAQDRGCLGALLEFVMAGSLTIHTEIPPTDVKFEEEIGSGTAGSVYKAVWRGKPVAVKKFHGVPREDFLKEISIMSVVQHPNLVECYGGCTQKDNLYIVQELMQANISDILRVKTISLDLGIKLRVALEVAMGMLYLHNHCNLIHRDLKSLNLLATSLNDIVTIKVCDFGVSRVVDRRKTMTGNVGTVSWIAPEVFGQRKYSEKADVYSFGIVLWELYTRKVPFTDIHSFSIPVAVIKGDRPSIPKDCPAQLKKLIRACWDPKPQKRPSFQRIIELITRVLEQLPPIARSQSTIDLEPLLKLQKKQQASKKSTGDAFANRDGSLTRRSRHQQQQITDAMTPPGSPMPHAPKEQGSSSSGTADAGQPATPSKKTSKTDSESGADGTSSPTSSRSGSISKIARVQSVALASSSAAADSSDKDVENALDVAEDSSEDDGDAANAGTTDSDGGGRSASSSAPGTPTRSLSERDMSSSTSESKSLSKRISDKSVGTPSGVRHAHTVTCSIPDRWAPPIAKLELQVNKYFSRLKQDLDLGTITVGDERYLLFRGHSLAVDFLQMVQSSFAFDSETESLEFAQNFLYDLGVAIGLSDSGKFLKMTASTVGDDVVAKNNLGLVVAAYTGMAFVSLNTESNYHPKKPEEELMVYEFSYSFEADSWRKKGNNKKSALAKLVDPQSVCMMSAGYLSGWGEGADGLLRATAEIQCSAKDHDDQDHQCVFVRATPSRLESSVRNYMNERGMETQPNPIPRFLKNRSDTLPVSHGKRTTSSTSSNAEEDGDANWFQLGFRKLFKRFKNTSSTSGNGSDSETAVAGSPKPLPKMAVKRFQPPELSIDEIDKRASQELNSFFIDPTTATVEMADERCVLLRGDALAYGFYDLVQDLFADDSRSAQQFAFKFLFDLGRTIGSSNQAWFVEKIGLGSNAIEKAWSLPVNMAYFGWCDLIIRSGLSFKELQKAGENFKIVCDVNNSFEAASYLKNRAEPGAGSESPKSATPQQPVCWMHAGYISGWFESSFKTRVVAIETQCKALGHDCCQFVIGHASQIKKHVPTSFHPAASTATSSGVLPLLAKFKEKRRESSRRKDGFDL
jgi:serine/threonine protein kinase